MVISIATTLTVRYDCRLKAVNDTAPVKGSVFYAFK